MSLISKALQKNGKTWEAWPALAVASSMRQPLAGPANHPVACFAVHWEHVVWAVAWGGARCGLGVALGDATRKLGCQVGHQQERNWH